MTAPTAPRTTAREHKLAAAFAVIATVISMGTAVVGYVGAVAHNVQGTAATTGTVGAVASLLALSHIHVKVAEVRAWIGDAAGVVSAVESSPSTLQRLEELLKPLTEHLNFLQNLDISHATGLAALNGVLGDLVGLHKSTLAQVEKLANPPVLVGATATATVTESSSTMAAQVADPPAAEAPPVVPVPDQAPSGVESVGAVLTTSQEPAPIPDVAGAYVAPAAAAPVPPGTGV